MYIQQNWQVQLQEAIYSYMGPSSEFVSSSIPHDKF